MIHYTHFHQYIGKHNKKIRWVLYYDLSDHLFEKSTEIYYNIYYDKYATDNSILMYILI